MATYCDYCNTHPADTYNRAYHDMQYGFPLEADNLLFERLILEINQAGLSWMTVLKKAENFRRAFDGFDVDIVAAYGEADVARLLADAGIIRNRLKVRATIENARRIQSLPRLADQRSRFFCGKASSRHKPSRYQTGIGSFDAMRCQRQLFRRHLLRQRQAAISWFGEMTRRTYPPMIAGCPVYKKIARLKPAWKR